MQNQFHSVFDSSLNDDVAVLLNVPVRLVCLLFLLLLQRHVDVELDLLVVVVLDKRIKLSKLSFALALLAVL